ncbi:MAG: 50S ribosomal protein L3 [Phycisphaera sp.]|nr:50S ribosomal protein L3 [Phycisphaera sp.]
MAAALLGRKVGMTRIFDEAGKNVPVTIIQAGPCFVSQIKTPDADGYAAIQLAAEDIKPRRSTMQQIGHDHKAGLSPKRFHKEFRVDEADLGGYELGQEITVESFESIKFVDVIGTSKGKGYQGVVKRHGFKGQQATHGVERKHRSPGSIGGHATDAGGSGGPKKGKKMPGQMGNKRITARSLDVVAIDKDNNLLLVKGPVPGGKDGFLVIRKAKRLYKRKHRLAQAS